MAVGVLTSLKVDPVAGSFSAKFTADASPSACSVFCGFTPRVVKLTQISGTPGNGAQILHHEGMAAASNVQITAAGAFTIPTSNGITLLTGSEASPSSAATGSPASAGPGFTLGTGVQVTASAEYLLEAYR